MSHPHVIEERAGAAAYGGPNWAARERSLADELGSVWARCGIDSEYAPLEAVLLHRPGAELSGVADADAHLLLETPDAARAAAQHDALAEAYRANGVRVAYVEPGGPGGPDGSATPPPNQMFCADLFVMTPSGAIVGRPASTVRAGEERWVARRLADLGVPILRSVGGRGTFEGADLCWLDPAAALIGRGLRTNAEGATQVAATLAELEVRAEIVDLPPGSMHLMAEVRFADRDLAFARAGGLPRPALELLRAHGYQVRFFPEDRDMVHGFSRNFVTLGPRRVLMPAGYPRSRAAYEEAGMECVEVDVDEIHKCAGGVGCLTGVVARKRVAAS